MKQPFYAALSLLAVGVMLATSCKKEEVPSISTLEVKEIAQNTAKVSAKISDDGGAKVITVGVCWGTDPNPTITGNATSSAASTRDNSFTDALGGLLPSTTYYVRAYATSSVGTGYGSSVQFTTLPAMLPTLWSTTVVDTSFTALTCKGIIHSTGGLPITDRGLCWSTSQNPTLADAHCSVPKDTVHFYATASGLTPKTTYYLRTYATNELGTVYGNQAKVTTWAAPAFTPLFIHSINETKVKLYDTLECARWQEDMRLWVCWSESPNPTMEDSKQEITDNIEWTWNRQSKKVTASVSPLSKNTKYYFRTCLQIKEMFAYSDNAEFTTPNWVVGTMTDVDNNTYRTIKIGDQEWMQENLKTTHYRDGSAIPQITDFQLWTQQTTGAFFVPNAKNNNFYNWYAVVDSRGLCPVGWHVPSFDEWIDLVNTIGNWYTAGDQLKEAELSSWPDIYEYRQYPNNYTGFSALSKGYGNIWEFSSMPTSFWSSSVINNSDPSLFVLGHSNNNSGFIEFPKFTGQSVRCLKD